MALAPLVGGLAGFLWAEGQAVGVSFGSTVARTGLINNYLTHVQVLQMESEMTQCLLRADCGDEEMRAIIERYRGLSAANRAALQACDTSACWEHHRQLMIRSEQEIRAVRVRTPMDMLSSLSFVMGQVTTFAQEELNRSFTAVVHPDHTVSGLTFEQWGQQNCSGRLDHTCLQRFQSMSNFQSLGNSVVTALELTTPLGLVVEGYACAANMTVSACAVAAASVIPTGALVRMGGKVFIRSGNEVLEVNVDVSGGTRTVTDIAPAATTRTATPSDVSANFNQNRAFWTSDPVQFNGNRVYQRNDLIDPNRIDPETGRTNLELMQAGRAPIGPDGYPVNLHHLTQSQAGAIAEVTQTLHRTNHGVLHMPNTVPSGINRAQFNAWRRDYWRNRANDFAGG